MLRVGVGGIGLQTGDVLLRDTVDSVGAATPAAHDLDVGLQLLQELDELGISGVQLLVSEIWSQFHLGWSGILS